MKITALCLSFTLLLAGCGGANRAPTPRPQSAPVVGSQVEKDRVVVEEAKAAAVLAPQVQPHTDAIQAAVAAAPAAHVEALAKQYEATIDARDKELKAAREQVAQFNSRLRFWITLGGYGFAFLLVAAGVAAFVLGNTYAFLGPKLGFALAGAGVSSFGLVTAYDWTQKHPWITGLVLLLILVSAALAYANHWHAQQTRKVTPPLP